MLLVHTVTARKIRKSHGNALVGLGLAVLQTVMLVAVFWVLFAVLGMRGAAIRGDFVVYLMSGVFLYMTFNSAMGAVAGAEGPTSPMMLHGPMSPPIAIISSALSSLYIQVLSLTLVLGVYQLGWGRVEIDQPFGALAMLLLSWASGAAVGLVFLGLRPWAPDLVKLVQQTYGRANMLASGKMFLANTLPAFMLPWFAWNPLFHTIDQARGFVFVNYTPRNSEVAYPLEVTAALLILGMMAEYVTRKNASLSWSSGT